MLKNIFILLTFLLLLVGCEWRWVETLPPEATVEAIADESEQVLEDLDEVLESEDPEEAAIELVEDYGNADEDSLQEEVAVELEEAIADPTTDVETDVEEIIDAVEDPEENAPNQECLIKGNINKRGEHIYHMPDGASYNATIVSEERGENWFCSEEDAVAAGFRKSLR